MKQSCQYPSPQHVTACNKIIPRGYSGVLQSKSDTLDVKCRWEEVVNFDISDKGWEGKC